MKPDISIANKESGVAVCSLWSEKAQLANQIGSSYFIIGNLYSSAGISQMVRTIFLNPQIRHLVIFGDDLSGSGDALIGFFNGRRDFIEQEIPDDALDVLRSNVAMHNLKGKSVADLNKLLAELNKTKLPAFAEPREFPEAKSKLKKLGSESTGFVARGKTIASTWLKIVDLVMKFGVEKQSEYPLNQKELLNIVAVIDDKDDSLAEFFNFTDQQLMHYLPTILTPFKPAKVSYTYGQRLFKREDEINLSQMENAIEKLKKCHHTRRAIAFTWRIKDDSSSTNPPCLTHIAWSVQNNQLFQTVHFRSHEVFEAWPMNLFALKELQDLLSAELGLEAGPLTCVSHSAHIYENKWNDALSVLEKHYALSPDSFEQDARGNFRICVENDKIVAAHLDNSGNPSGYEFEGSSPKELVSKIFHSQLVSSLDHAAYLGSEIEKAFAALKTGKEYIQDKELELDGK